jgi:hypothetical protein
MLHKTISTRVLELFVKILGSDEAARTALRCSQADINEWSTGITEPPRTAFERMVKIIVDHQKKQIASMARHSET